MPSTAFATGTELSAPAVIRVCHGHGCARRTKVDLGGSNGSRLAAIMAQGRDSAAAERRAIAKAVGFFEELSTVHIGVRDGPKSVFEISAPVGQMDCVDESTNTRALLLHLSHRKLLAHHRVEANVSRGFFADWRYPHFTAVIRDPDGNRWAVDSWYEQGGGAPDILPLSEWRKRGVAGGR